MTTAANPRRGEADLVVADKTFILRPSFENLVAVEEELGSLFALVERASDGTLRFSEITALLWHCIVADPRPTRDAVGEAVLEIGLVSATQPVRSILAQVLQGTS